MKLYAPSYYKNFKCVADKCSHSCCVGWEIDVDEKTLEKYRNLQNGYKKEITESVSLEGTPHFKLSHGERCPHLDENGLCKIILNLGEDYLCDICREHPRFYNFTDVVEVGIGVCCPEAAKIVLSSPDYQLFECIGDLPAEEYGLSFNAREHRDQIYGILKDKTLCYSERLEKIYRSYEIEKGADGRWLEIINSLEYLDVNHKKLFLSYSANRRPSGADCYLERFLAYLIYRHTAEAEDRLDFASRLSFCLFCERLLASLISEKNAEALEEIIPLAVAVSEEIEYSDENIEAVSC